MTAYEHVVVEDDVVLDQPRPRYTGQWQPDGDDPRTFVEGRGWSELAEAIAWGRARAPCVFLDARAPDDDEPFTSERFAVGTRSEGMPRWPGDPPPDEGREQGYRGTVYLRDEWRYHTSGYRAIHRDENGREIARSAHYDLDDAIDWGRSRAAIVVADVFPARFSWPPAPSRRRYSAGGQDPPDERLPRLRPLPPATTMTWLATFPDGATFHVDAPTRAVAGDAASDRYVREILDLGPGSYTIPCPEVEPHDEPSS